MNCLQKQPPLEVPNVIRIHSPSGTPAPHSGYEKTLSISAEIEAWLGIQSIKPNFVKDQAYLPGVSGSCSVMSDSLWPHGLYSPWSSPGQNTGVGSHSFSRGSSQPRDQTQVCHIAGGFFTSWATREVPLEMKLNAQTFQPFSCHFQIQISGFILASTNASKTLMLFSNVGNHCLIIYRKFQSLLAVVIRDIKY